MNCPFPNQEWEEWDEWGQEKEEKEENLFKDTVDDGVEKPLAVSPIHDDEGGHTLFWNTRRQAKVS